MLRPVVGGTKHQFLPLAGAFQPIQHILMGSHLHTVPAVKIRLIHSKSIVVLRYRHHILRPCRAKELGPGCRVKLLSLEHGDKILVAELIRLAVMSHMVAVAGSLWVIHRSGIPLVVVAGHTVNPPVNKNAQLGVLIPAGRSVTAQAAPVRLVRTGGDHPVDLRQICLLIHLVLPLAPHRRSILSTDYIPKSRWGKPTIRHKTYIFRNTGKFM